MKTDRPTKLARLGKHLPKFPGYTALHLGETDLQLRRVLAGRLEGVKERLTDLLALVAGTQEWPQAAPIMLSLTELGSRFLLVPEEKSRAQQLPPDREEQLFDFDLALLERVAALDTLLDRLEVADALAGGEVLAELQLALEEIEELFRRRDDLLLKSG